MNAEEFRKFAHEAVDAAVDYMENINDRPVRPAVEPNYLRDLLPQQPPAKPENFQTVIDDFNHVIMPGMTHWHSGKFCAYYPTGFSYPSLLGEIYTAMLATNGFNWLNGPAITELEYLTMEWMAKMLGLDAAYYSGDGRGIIQGSASEAVFMTIVAAKNRTIKALQAKDPSVDPWEAATKLIVYASDQTHSCTEKAAKIMGLRFRALPTDDTCVLKAETLRQAVDEDQAQGLVPFFVTATFGTTSTASIDDIPGIVDTARHFGIWSHIDAAYAGSALVCPEFRSLAGGINGADSFNVNLHKWLLVHFDCTCLYVKDKQALKDAIAITPSYQQYKELISGAVENLCDYQISLGRRFRALKVWFTIRSYGISGMQKFIRGHIDLITHFKSQVEADGRFEIMNKVQFNLICIRIKPEYCQIAAASPAADPTALANLTNSRLVDLINASGVFLIKSDLHGKVIIRVVIGSFKSDMLSTDFIWSVIKRCTDEVLAPTICTTTASTTNEAG
ncbi:hypothetical protein IWQ60_006153 [Tieghemiomyces parasiticus]|uniref:Aromatic-L-amino-acid decarboxylase n=1 Tax=Tieghemiomyces parasiticus TaxID=78921 RepID=A0A9W8A8M4_9FUNG|nr:hypothetical protein IWQ60_006153 [Tieghemiomyces parasiticus]